MDGDVEDEVLLFKQVGKVKELRKLIDGSESGYEQSTLRCTCWYSTHALGNAWSAKSIELSSAQKSDKNAEFVVVHNGIVTNYRELKTVLQKKGFRLCNRDRYRVRRCAG